MRGKIPIVSTGFSHSFNALLIGYSNVDRKNKNKINIYLT